MKKVFGMSISFVLVFAIMLLPSVALADPAPHLTSVSIIGITSDGNDYEWSNPNLSGTEGVIAVYCEGTIWTPNYPVIRQSGVIVPTTQALPNDYVTDSSGYVVGAIYHNRK